MFVPQAVATDPFKKLKQICVPLLGASRLTPVSAPVVSWLLSELLTCLRATDSNDMTPALISYTFFPLSSILQRNSSSEIPDQILEKLLTALGVLCEGWWWSFETKIWEQIFMLCSAVVGGIEKKGKGKDRDHETKEAAVRCLFILLRKRTGQEAVSRFLPAQEASKISHKFREHARSELFTPILGQTVDSLLGAAESRNHSLSLLSLDVLYLLIGEYAHEDLIPTILPGVVSVMTKVCFSAPHGKGWANGDVVSKALKVLETIVVYALGDEICIKEGAIIHVEELEDIVSLAGNERKHPSTKRHPRPYATPRTSIWLRGTSSQLHIAINTLTPLTSHPSPSALHALSQFSATTLRATLQTLPQTQPLLLSFLLSLSNSIFESVSSEAFKLLLELLTIQSPLQPLLIQTLMNNTGDNLSSLPRLLSLQADEKVEHTAGLIRAVCRLANSCVDVDSASLSTLSKGIGKLLGPTGGIEKWGWSLLSVLELVEPSIIETRTSAAQLTLESNAEFSPMPLSFPEVTFKNVQSRSTKESLEKMFRALGRAAGDGCLFSVEWFSDFGRSRTNATSVTALWCSCRLLEGVADISLSSEDRESNRIPPHTKRLEKLSRSLARSVAELWDNETSSRNMEDEIPIEEDSLFQVRHQKGLVPLHDSLMIVNKLPNSGSAPSSRHGSSQSILHKAHCLQLIALTAGILQSCFSSLFIYVVYPVLHSLVSPFPYLSSAALATLHFITVNTSYASPANLLLANFDYALDAIARRLSRRWLDVDATKVLGVMIRLVGTDIIDRASDVVEECFDRLDDFHGYEVIVEGLVDVLAEIVKVVEASSEPATFKSMAGSPQLSKPERIQDIDSFFVWFHSRSNPITDQDDNTDYGPAPHEYWGKDAGVGEEQFQRAENDNNEPPNPIQSLTKQIVSRSICFLTHRSPIIRSRILSLLSSSSAVLPEAAFLPSIHAAWPFILNRFEDSETFVITAAASLVEALAIRFGSFMFRRIWDDIWPRFRTLLNKLDVGSATSALAKQRPGTVGTESAYTHSHRLYCSILKTMTGALASIHPHDTSFWEVVMAFRRFLDGDVHKELQKYARELYIAAAKSNVDAVWLVLSSTSEKKYPIVAFMDESRWNIDVNLGIIFNNLL